MRVLYKPKYDNVRELLFSATSSNYWVGVEGRGGTIHRLHVSEAAFMHDFPKVAASTFETVPRDGDIIVESTANGLNEFYDWWEESQKGKTEFATHFYNWTWDAEYRDKPADMSFRKHYQSLARSYDLIVDIQERFNLTDEQFYWYYLKARRLRNLVKQEYPTTPEEAFLSANAAAFDLFRVAQIVGKPKISTFIGVDLYYKAQKGHQYIMGIDTAEGVGNDGTAIEVVDADKMREVASFYDKTIRPDQTATLAIRLAQMYNNAYIVPERNSSGLTTVLKLQELGYNNIYRDRTIDKITKKAKNQLGFRTTSTTRDVMIDDFVEKFDNGEIEINSPEVISQMKTFVRKDNGKREHEGGKHDDSLFALFLAIQGLKYYRSGKAFLDYYKREYGKKKEESSSEVAIKFLNNPDLQRSLQKGDHGFT